MSPEVNSLNVAFSTMEPLLRLDAQGNVKPLLDESWEVVDNTRGAPRSPTPASRSAGG